MPSFLTHFTATAPLPVKRTRSSGFVAPVSNTSLPSATSSAFAAIVLLQSTVSSSMMSLQKSPTLASGFCSESVRPTVHASSDQPTCTSLVDVAVTRSSGSVGALAAEIGYAASGRTQPTAPP